MKQIHNWNDLQPYGVEFVGHNPRGYQFLCDLTPEGKLLVEAVFGCSLAIPKEANGRYRILMPPNMWESIAVVALWRASSTGGVREAGFRWGDGRRSNGPGRSGTGPN